MAILTGLTCQNCGQELTNLDDCAHCGYRIARFDNSLAETLDGFVANCRLRLDMLEQNAFQQVMGLWGPSPTDPEGIAFTPQEALLAHRFLRHAAIRCLQVAISADGQTMHSLMIANTERGLKRAEQAARKAAKKARARLALVSPESGLH